MDHAELPDGLSGVAHDCVRLFDGSSGIARVCVGLFEGLFTGFREVVRGDAPRSSID